MNLNDAKKRIQAYLCSNKTWPLLVDVQTKSDKSEIIDYFKVGENTFPDIESFCNDDGDLKVDELYAAVSANVGNTFITNVTGFLKLHGELATKRALKTLATSGISGHVVVLTYQCKNYLKFSDPRIVESGRVVIVDGASDTTPGICLVNPSISAAFVGCYSGLQKIGAIVENCPQNTAYISTMALKDSFPESIYHISQLNNGYDILVRNDPRTKSVPNSFGTPEQWNYALQKMGQNGNWSQLIEGEFGSELNLCHAIASYQKYDDNKKWLYFIALSISGANVEVHGGASLEEVAVPIIEITRKQTNIEAFILDSSRVITLAAKEHAALRIYVGVKSNSIGIMLNGQYYDALATSEPYIYSVDLADYTRKGTYTFEILNGNDILASGQKFEIKKMGMSENAGLFDF